jgi:hypothetical protein
VLWDACEQWADQQLGMSQPPPESLKKGAPSGSPRRNRAGNRNPLRAAGRCPSGF